MFVSLICKIFWVCSTLERNIWQNWVEVEHCRHYVTRSKVLKGFEGKKESSSEILERKKTDGKREKEYVENFWLRIKEKGSVDKDL